MKHATVAILGALLFLASLGGLAWAGLEGSKHDFSKQAWSGGETCGVCHTPHRQEPPKAAPLWDPTADLTRTFGASRLRAQAGPGTAMCLRCHDGTVARQTLAGAPAERYANRLHPALFAAAHEGTDHPVGVRYPDLRKGYRAAATVIASGAVTLPHGRVECISCHDPHAANDLDAMLVMSNSRSALCLTCHQK
jgi:predicted CXXCH cytochrome family protein